MAHKHGVARGAHNHAQHGDPQVRHADGRPGTIPDAQHVAHGFEEGVGVLLTPGNVLQRERERQRGGGGSYCQARHGGKALRQAQWKDRLSFDGSLNL